MPNETAGELGIAMSRDIEAVRADSEMKEKASGRGLLVIYKYKLKDFWME